MSDELFIKESPYRPPDADLQPERLGVQPPPGGGSPDDSRIDPGRAVQYPFTNPQWWKTALIVGVLQLVPIFGLVVAYGWMQRMFDAVRGGSDEQMPSVSVSDDLGRGWRLLGTLFVGWLCMMVIMWVGMMVPIGLAAAIGAIGGEDLAAAIGGMAGIIVMFPLLFGMLGLYVLMPELIRRCLNGDWFGLLRWRRAVGVVIAAPVPYITLLATMIVGLVVMYVGMFALYFGFLLTMPLGMAIGMHGLAQWDRYLEHSQLQGRH